MRILTGLFVSLFIFKAHAGLIELGYSYSQMESKIDENNFQETVSHTGSFSWYFLEMSAIELNYTKGEGIISAQAVGDPNPTKYRMGIELYGADMVVTFAKKDWMFQPYVKGGAAWVDKRIYRTQDGVAEETKVSSTDKDDAVPSWGVGFKMYLFSHIKFRASYDRWRSGKRGDSETWDNAVRAGLSFIF